MLGVAARRCKKRSTCPGMKLLALNACGSAASKVVILNLPRPSLTSRRMGFLPRLRLKLLCS